MAYSYFSEEHPTGVLILKASWLSSWPGDRNLLRLDKRISCMLMDGFLWYDLNICLSPSRAATDFLLKIGHVVHWKTD